MKISYLCIANAIKMENRVNQNQSEDQTGTAWRIINSSGEIKVVHVDNKNHHFLKIKKTDKTGKPQEELLFGQIQPIIQYLGYSQQELAEILEVNASTLSRWRKGDKPIGKLRSKTIYDIDGVITKGIRIFGSESEFKQWLITSNYALGDKKPAELLKDPYGIEWVDNAIEAISWGNVI